jgi:nitrate reductase NapE
MSEARDEAVEPNAASAVPGWLRGRRGEQVVFLLLAVVIWPIIAVVLVGGYGFLVWMYQIIAGPPGPPGG